MNILGYLLPAITIAVTLHAATPNEIRIDWIDFADANFTTINYVAYEPISGSGVINDLKFLDGYRTNFVAGGEFTKVYALLDDGGVGYIYLTVNDVWYGDIAEVSGLSPSGTSVNNIVRLDWNVSAWKFTLSKLSQWSDGGVDGVSGKVNTLFVPSGGSRVYIGGWFGTAGGYSNGRGFAYYRFDGYGWYDVSSFPMNITGPSYAEILGLEANGSDVLVHGSEDVMSYVDQYGEYATYNYYVHGTWLTSSRRWMNFYGPP